MDVRLSCHLEVIADEEGMQARKTLATEPHAASIVTKGVESYHKHFS